MQPQIRQVNNYIFFLRDPILTSVFRLAKNWLWHLLNESHMEKLCSLPRSLSKHHLCVPLVLPDPKSGKLEGH